MKSQKGISLINLVIIIIVVMTLGAFLISKLLYIKADKLKAEYEARFHTITFDTDGGNYISPKKVETFGGISNVYAEKNGYIFEGWLLDGQLVDVKSSIPLTQDVTLTAKYRKKLNTENNNSNFTNNPLSSSNVISVGQTYKDNTVVIKYVALNNNFTNYSEYTTVKSGYKIIQANFEFENLGRDDFYASVYNFNCYADNYACESFWNLDDDILGSTLSQGRKVRGNVYFEVPQNSYSITIEYELDMWSGKKVLFKVK